MLFNPLMITHFAFAILTVGAYFTDTNTFTTFHDLSFPNSRVAHTHYKSCFSC